MPKNDDAPEPVGAMEGEGRWTKTSRIWIPEVDESHRIRVAHIRSDLSLEDRAAIDGQKNLPAQNEKVLNEPQIEICNRVHGGILLLNQFLGEQLGLAVQAARRQVPKPLEVEQFRADISAEVDSVVEKFQSNLYQLRRDDLSQHRDLRYFRHVNGLKRSAHYKESPTLVFGILMVMFLGESLLNGSLLAQVVSNGLIGGAVLAGVISAINVGAGLIAGLWGWRNINHKEPRSRVLGGVIMAACHGLVLFWNLFVAHFREVAETLSVQEEFDFNPARLSEATIDHIHVHGLFGVESLQSWALLLLGLFIHFMAAKEGWDDVADRYPDYKKYDKRAHDARQAYEEELAELRNEARAAIEATESHVAAAAAEARDAHHAIGALLQLAQERLAEVKDSEDQWVAGGAQLLKTYRDVNIQIRDEGSAPAYFAVFPTAQDYRRGAFGIGASAPPNEVDERRRAAETCIETLKDLQASAKINADGADSAVKEVNRHINLTLRRLDKRVEVVDRDLTERATLSLNELEPEAPADAKSKTAANDAAA